MFFRIVFENDREIDTSLHRQVSHERRIGLSFRCSFTIRSNEFFVVEAGSGNFRSGKFYYGLHINPSPAEIRRFQRKSEALLPQLGKSNRMRRSCFSLIVFVSWKKGFKRDIETFLGALRTLRVKWCGPRFRTLWCSSYGGCNGLRERPVFIKTCVYDSRSLGTLAKFFAWADATGQLDLCSTAFQN